MQPFLSHVGNFDAKKGYEFEYTYLGAERILTNELSIRENKKNSVPVYNGTSTKFDKIHILSSGVLQNGKSYLAKIRVKVGEEWSEWSSEVSFTCLATPKFVYQSLQDGKFVYNNDILMNIVFQQEQGDKVDTFEFVLMDHNKVPIKKYPVRRPLLKSPNLLQERITDLVKGRLYYIGCRVRTVNGVDFFDSHELIPHFAAPSLLGKIKTHNQSDSGQILIQSYLKQTLGVQTRPHIEGKELVSPLSYVYLEDDWVVIPPDKPLQYKRLGMAQASDWVGKIWCKNIPNGTFLEIYPENNNGIGMKFIKYDDYIVCEKEFLNEGVMGIKSRSRSNIVSGLGLKQFYMYVKVIEFRVDIYIEAVS